MPCSSRPKLRVLLMEMRRDIAPVGWSHNARGRGIADVRVHLIVDEPHLLLVLGLAHLL